MNECPFCSLQHSDSALLISNDFAYAVLDIAPIRPGHALVIPRRHVEDFFELSEQEQTAMLRLANGLASALKDSCNPLRVGMLISGLELSHAHLHIIPIHDCFDITSKVVLDGCKVRAPEEKLQGMRDQLRKRLNGLS